MLRLVCEVCGRSLGTVDPTLWSFVTTDRDTTRSGWETRRRSGVLLSHNTLHTVNCRRGALHTLGFSTEDVVAAVNAGRRTLAVGYANDHPDIGRLPIDQRGPVTVYGTAQRPVG
jgi:hypothetical protein